MAETIALTVADVVVQQDADGRFSLNDLHRASGGEDRAKPGNWLRSQQAEVLIEELSAAHIRAAETVAGGAFQGTFVVWELVYAYAMWISPAFFVKVIRGYHASVSGGAAATLSGTAGQPLSVAGAMAAMRNAGRLAQRIQESKNPAEQRLLYGHLLHTQRILGEPAPSLTDLILARDPAQPELPGMKGGAA